MTHVNSKTNQGELTAAILKEQEGEKKRKYQERMLEVEMGSLTPLILEPTARKGSARYQKLFIYRALHF